MKLPIVFLLCLALAVPVSAASMGRQTPDAAVLVLKSQQGFVLLYNQGKLHFTMEFVGREWVPVDSEQMFFKVDGRVLQLQVAKLTDFLPGSEKTKFKDTEILEKHRAWEQEFLGGLLKAKLNVTSGKVTTKGDREGLLWHFPIPDGMNQQVNQQVFLTSVVGEQVLVLNAGVEKNDTVTSVSRYLTDCLSSLRVSDKSIDTKTVQEEIRKR